MLVKASFSSLRPTALPLLAFLALVIAPINSIAGEPPETHHRAGERVKVPDPQKYGAVASQELDGAFWRTDAGFHATIRISNIVQTATIRVTPVLFMSDGTEFVMPAVNLKPSGVATIDVNDALMHAPDSVAEHLSSFGSAAVRFQWPWASAITATIRSVDAPRSLIYSNPFQPSITTNVRIRERRSAANKGQSAQKAADLSPQNVTLEGLWWRRDPEDSGFVALTNRSSAEVRAKVKVLAGGNDQKLQTEVLLGPHQTHQVNLKQLFDSLPSGGANSGGIRVQYEGVRGSIAVTGGMENVAAGYSAKIPFLYAPAADTKLSSWGLASVGIIHGPPDPMMQFPADVNFTAYAVLRNISAQPMQVVPKLLATPGRQVTTPEIKAQTLSLPVLTIKPGETTSLDLDSALIGGGFKDVTANLTLSLNASGVSGALLALIGSVDKSGSYVFEVEPHPVSSSLSKSICFFEVGNGTDTMVSLWNHSAQDEDLLVTLFFDGGHYKLPMHLAAQQSAMFNVLEIIKARTPDAEGNVIPQSVQRGSILVSGVQNETQRIEVSLNAATYSVRDATCEGTCQQCMGYDSMWMEPSSLTFGVGQTGAVQAVGNYSTGAQFYMDATYSSSSTAIATVSGNTVTAVAAGSADILADSFSPIDTWACSGLMDQNGDPEMCPEYADMEAEAPMTVPTFTGVLTARDNFSGRSTTNFGIAEVINLSFTTNPAGASASSFGGLQWSIVSGGGTITAGTDGTGTYTAPSSAATVVLKLAVASGSAQGTGNNTTITIIAPSGAHIIQTTLTNLRHTNGTAGVGFKGSIFLEPATVSFAGMSFAEGTVNAVASGFYAVFNGIAHAADTGTSIGSCNSTSGCTVQGTDTIDTHDKAGPFFVGDLLWAIPWQYFVGTGSRTTFTTANHHQFTDILGKASIEKKGAGPFSKNVNDPTSTF